MAGGRLAPPLDTLDWLDEERAFQHFVPRYIMQTESEGLPQPNGSGQLPSPKRLPLTCTSDCEEAKNPTLDEMH
jgi:hypothetical protein